MTAEIRPSDQLYLVEFLDLFKRLKEVSHGEHQWKMRPLRRNPLTARGTTKNFVLLAYSNPQEQGLPNIISYLLPMIPWPSRASHRAGRYISFASCTMIPMSRGLYHRAEGLVWDTSGDYDRFMQLMKPFAQSPPPDLLDRFQDDAGPIADRAVPLSIGGTSYEQEVQMYLDALSWERIRGELILFWNLGGR
jgi:hypothetical protein